MHSFKWYHIHLRRNGESPNYSSCTDQILPFFPFTSNKEFVKSSVWLAMMKMVFSTALRFTIINEVGGVSYFASGSLSLC